jgi:monoamine oxidase
MPAQKFDVIVIGGGVAGLAAAGAIARQGRSVAVLEARNRLGGRIHTVNPGRGAKPIELGAEFVHTGNRQFWRLIRKHRLNVRLVPAKHRLFENGELEKVDDLTERIASVTRQIDPKRMRGKSFAEFLRQKGHAFTEEDWKLATNFVEGFQAAPRQQMSASAVAGETLDVSEQFHLPDGYAQVVRALEQELPESRARVFLRTPVSKVIQQRRDMLVRAGPAEYAGRAVVVTVPLGVLQAGPRQRGAIAFQPPLRTKMAAVRQMGVGQAIRVTLHFRARSWQKVRRRFGGLGFVHSRIKGFPVWWSLSRERRLTGWAGGPNAIALRGQSDGAVLGAAVKSLGRLLGISGRELRGTVQAWWVWNWSKDPLSRGAYSFAAAGARKAGEKLRRPIRHAIFFAGEATAEDEEVGTVHGALTSGLRAAKEVQRALKKGSRSAHTAAGRGR